LKLTDGLDDAHRAVLELLPDGLLDLSDLDATRSALTAMTALLAGPLPDGVLLDVREVASHDDALVEVRTFRPEARAVRPALLFLHGGGLVLGSAAMDDALCASIAAELDIVVASVDYRLAPESPYPTPLEDCYAALRWLATTADELGVDANRIAVMGQSAGGGLAAALCLLARDRGEVSICFQVLTYPMLDDTTTRGVAYDLDDTRVWNGPANAVAWGHYLGDLDRGAVPGYAAPARATDLAGLPPAIITVGDRDLFLHEDIRFADALLRAGVPVELHVHPGALHGSIVFAPDAGTSRRWLRDERDALARGLGIAT
jgi:acetyl esterase/lipase